MGMPLLDNQMLVIGGIRGYSETEYHYTDHISRYDLAADRWFDFPSPEDYVPAHRQFPATAVVGGKAYLFGGLYDDAPQQNVWSYSLKRIRQDKPLNDTMFSAESLEIDLSDYFSTSGAESVEYSICESYDDALLSASIDNSMLTLEKIGQQTGTTELAINAFDSEDTISSNSFSVELQVGIQTFGDHQVSVFPNPASVSITFTYTLEEAGATALEIYTPSGRIIGRFSADHAAAGHHRFEWNVEDFPGGLYLMVLKTDRTVTVKKVLIQ
jgi:hypothetical protein